MCRYIFSVALAFLTLCMLKETCGQTTEVARCFQYTWLGPRWNNESIFLNATCSDATRLSTGVPCFQPLVVSYDGSWPDVSYVWRNHRENASCILADNDVCATYTYYFDGQVENSTSMCTRVIDGNDNAIRSGCYTQTNGSFAIKACFCRSVAGLIPCNGSGTTATIATAASVALAVVLMLYKDLTLTL